MQDAPIAATKKGPGSSFEWDAAGVVSCAIERHLLAVPGSPLPPTPTGGEPWGRRLAGSNWASGLTGRHGA